MSLVLVAKLADIPAGGTLKVNGEGADIMLTNVGGRVYALADRCPHMGGSLSGGMLDGTTIKCPNHGAMFDIATGKNLGKAKILFLKMKVKDAKSYAVEVKDAEVFVELP